MLDFSNTIDLPLVWGGLIAVAVFVYVFLDGFDLGCGILFPFAPTDHCRSRMMNSIAPFWDGNETWLVLGGGGLFAAFPVAYGIIMSGLYIPVTLMLFGLIFRGVAFEFRFKAEGNQRKLWDRAFNIGSTVAAFFQGVMLGALVQGLEVTDRLYSGGAMDWLSPFSIFCGFALIVGYALLGSTWLIMKTEGETQDWAYQILPKIIIAMLVVTGTVSLTMPFLDARIKELWFSTPNIFFLALLPIATAICFWLLWKNQHAKNETQPFILSLLIFLFGFMGICISLFPWIVPYAMTVHQAAAANTSLSIMLVGAAIMLPIIGAYTAYSYYVFRGKANHEAMY